jgi:hypothetical protein
VHAKAIALVGLQLSLQESWNVPNAELIIFCTSESANGFVFTFALSLWVFTGLPSKIFLLNVNELM